MTTIPRLAAPGPLAVGFAVAATFVSLLLLGHNLDIFLPGDGIAPIYAFMSPDDLDWIDGTVVGNPWRFTTHGLVHVVCPYVFGKSLYLFLLPGVVVHVVNAMLVGLLLFEVVRVFPTRVANPPRTGALLAGFVFLLYHTRVLTEISFLPYELVTLFALLMMLFSVRFFEQPRITYGLLIVAAHGLALVSHAYSLALPGFVLLLEVVYRRCSKIKRSWWSSALLYAALGGSTLQFLRTYWLEIMRQGGEDVTGHPWFGIFHYARYLGISVTQIVYTPWSSTNQSVGEASGFHQLLTVLLIGCASGLMLRALHKRKPLGIAEMVVLFFVAWNGLAFFQLMARDTFMMSSRYYLHAVGTAMVVGFVAQRGLEVVPHWPRLVSAVLLVGIPTGLGAVNPELLHGASVVRTIATHPSMAAAPRMHGSAGVRGADLSWRNLTGASFEQANLYGACLLWSDLTKANLRGADLRFSNLSKARFWETDIRGTRFDGCHTIRTEFQGARTDSTTSFKGAQMVWVYMEGMDLRGVAFDGANLSGGSLRGADLANARLPGAGLSSTILDGANFEHCDLRKADLTRANAVNARFVAADLRESWLVDAELAGADLRQANLTGADLTNADLSGADLRNADLTNADLSGAVLDGAYLQGAVLDGARLSNASMEATIWDSVTTTGPQDE